MILSLKGREVEVTRIEYQGEDTYFAEAFYLDTDDAEKAKLSDDELDALAEAHPDRLYEAMEEYLRGAADAAYDRWKDEQME